MQNDSAARLYFLGFGESLRPMWSELFGSLYTSSEPSNTPYVPSTAILNAARNLLFFPTQNDGGTADPSSMNRTR